MHKKVKTKKGFVRAVLVLLLALLIGAVLGAKWPQIIKYKKMVWYHYHSEKPFPKNYLEGLSSSEKRVLESHLKKSLKNLENTSEYEVAAAINDYLFQYLKPIDHSGKPHQILLDGHAICGGHATTMCALLVMSGVEGRLAYLLGVPYQGAHSLVQVSFSDGSQGLYDPTCGVFWAHSENKHPISIQEIVESPSLSKEGIFASRQNKGNAISQGIVSVDEGYSHNPKLDEDLHYQDMFVAAKGVGVSYSGDKEFVRIMINKVPFACGEKYNAPLDSLREENGSFVSWVHMLGKDPWFGYDVAHIYEVSNLSAGQRYELILYYRDSLESKLSMQVLGGFFEGAPNRKTKHMMVDNQIKNGISIIIQPEKENIAIVIDNSGFMTLGSIELRALNSS